MWRWGCSPCPTTCCEDRQAGGLGLLSLCVATSDPARLSAALLYKPVDRVTRSTLVLHVSHPTWALLILAFLASDVRQCCPPLAPVLPHTFIEDAEMRGSWG